jgi:hypothetical protein
MEERSKENEKQQRKHVASDETKYCTLLYHL